MPLQKTNLPPFTETLFLFAKVQKMKAGASLNPFIDPQGYRNFIAGLEKAYNEQVQRDRAGK